MSRLLFPTLAALFAFATIGLSTSGAQAEEPWTSWRGPHADGHSHETDLPVNWTPADVAWKAPLKGRGQSSPIFAGDRIFLTTGVNDGRERVILCLHRKDGRVLWEKTVWTGDPEPLHKMNTWASATCATDGERVYAFFGRGGGLFCYTVEGEKVWEKDLGRFESPWGAAASPVLASDLIIQNCDSDKDAYIIGIDKKTGAEVWRTPRETIRGWSSPILLRVDDHDEIVVNGHFGPKGYDPATGKEIWYCKSFNGRGEPTVTPGPNGLLFVLNGLRGDAYALRRGGKGTITQSHMAWHTPRKTGRDLPSPIVVKNAMLAMEMNGGIVTAYNVDDGAEMWRERVSGNFSASPTAWRDLAFFVAESGETVAIDPVAASETRIASRNTVGAADDEIFRAGVVPSEGQVFLRSDKALYCIGKRMK